MKVLCTECGAVIDAGAKRRRRTCSGTCRMKRSRRLQTPPPEMVAVIELDELVFAELPGSWVEEAACAGKPSDVFFPERGDSVALAKEICRLCPVQGECLQYALRTRQEDGIWGGKSARERKKMRWDARGRTA